MDVPEDINIQRLQNELHALTEIAKTLTAHLNLPELLNAVLKKIHIVLEPAQTATIMLWNQSSGLFRAIAAHGYDLRILENVGLRAGESITGKVFDQEKPILYSTYDEVAEAMADLRTANRSILAQAVQSDKLPLCSLAAPLIVGSHKYGVLVLDTWHSSARFSINDLPFVQSIADLIALAIDRAQLEAKADEVQEARQAELLRSEVMAALSHQLRLPLSAIKGYSTALLLEEIDWSREKRIEFLELIDEETDNMQSMITEMLDSSLIDVGQLTLELQPVRLPHLVNDITAEMQRRTDCHQIMVDFPSDFPILDADPNWIKQVFRNIIDNAIKFSPDGGLIIIRGESRLNDVVIGVSDQGVGISPEDLIPLFEKYYRVKPNKNIHVSGTGLGLPVARAIVEAHHGRIWAESKVGQGTTIYFSLPYNPII
jgi:K+-sensing histidine kinase KdpD